MARVYGGPGPVATADGKLIGALEREIPDGLILSIDLVASPDKLAGPLESPARRRE